jgi:hypothetical protein
MGSKTSQAFTPEGRNKNSGPNQMSLPENEHHDGIRYKYFGFLGGLELGVILGWMVIAHIKAAPERPD